MAMKEGMRQGCMAVGVSVIVQAVLSINRQESFFRMFVVTDAIVVATCALFRFLYFGICFVKRWQFLNVLEIIMNGKKILYVEDDLSLIEGLKYTLEKNVFW